MKQLMTGNEAVARGAFEAGVHFASAYPGTPSTEIMENLATYPKIYAEWGANEKVALEAAIGASFAGARSMASMKHVGLNVAADPLFTFAYMGVNGGCVVVTADEPGQHSSQNEQDNRNYAKAAKLPMFEPADSQECLSMIKDAFAFSEQFNSPVLFRMTTRVCHSKSIVEINERQDVPIKEYVKDAAKRVCVPANAKLWRRNVEERTAKLSEYTEKSAWNKAEYCSDSKIGFVTSGMCYYYAKEVFGDKVNYLKLGFTNPLPVGLITDFCKKMDIVFVLEENDPYMEDEIRKLGFECRGNNFFPSFGEMMPDTIRSAFAAHADELKAICPDLVKMANSKSDTKKESIADQAIMRAPTFCAGCPHRGFFYELGKMKDVMVTGDIGCYTLGYSSPYNAMDTCVCMGASISTGHGAQKVFNMTGNKKRVVTVLGDSTFFHTGINSLINTIYNNSNTVNVILDNRITGMTGHQQNPGSGFTAQGDPTNMIIIDEVVRALGIKHVYVIDPNNLDSVREILNKCLALNEPSVIITRWPCVLKKLSEADKEEFSNVFKNKYSVDKDKCIGCKICFKTGCPALRFDEVNKKASIHSADCVGCEVCAQVCPKKAISKEVHS